MNRKFDDDKFRADWQILRIKEANKGLFERFQVRNIDRKDMIVNLSKLYRLFLEEREELINQLFDPADQAAIYSEYREWWDKPDCEVITSRTVYKNLTHTDHSKEIQSKTYFAQFRLCYTDEEYEKWYEPF